MRRFTMLAAALVLLSACTETSRTATSRSADTPTASAAQPAAAKGRASPSSVSGSGDAVKYVTVTPGRYAIDASVTGNTDDSFGTSMESNFIVVVTDSAGDMCAWPANEIGAVASGSEVMVVGDDIFNCAPGELAVDVTAEGRWSVKFTAR